MNLNCSFTERIVFCHRGSFGKLMYERMLFPNHFRKLENIFSSMYSSKAERQVIHILLLLFAKLTLKCHC